MNLARLGSLRFVVGVLGISASCGFAQNEEAPLLKELRGGKTEAIEQRIEKGLDPNTTIDEIPLLTWAIRIAGRPKELEEVAPDPFSVPNKVPSRFWPDAVEITRLLLKKGADIDLAGAGGITPLIATVREAELELVKVILENNPEIDQADEEGKTALHHIVVDGRDELLPILLKAGADVNRADREGITPLMRAAIGEDFDLCEVLLDKGADPGRKTKRGETAVHLLLAEMVVGTPWGWDSDEREAELLKRLASGGVDLKAQTRKGETALHRAAAAGGKDTVSFLVERSGDTNAADGQGRTALHHAMVAGREETIRILLDAGANAGVVAPDLGSAVAMAARRFHDRLMTEKAYLDLVGLVLKNNAGVDAADAEGRTALIWAAASNVPEVVDRLIDAGADIELASKDGRTPLMWAACTDAEKTIARLLEHGANAAATDANGWTALRWAGTLGQEKGVEALGGERLPKRAEEEPSRPEADGGSARIEPPEKSAAATPLHRAAEVGLVDEVAALIEAGAKVDAVDKNGETPLAWATANGHRKVVALLLEAGADPRLSYFPERRSSNRRRDYGEKADAKYSAYWWVIQMGRPEILELLLEAKKPWEGVQSNVSLADAVRKADLKSLDLLLRHGVEVKLDRNAFDYSWSVGSNHPFLLAAQLGDSRILKRLAADREQVDADDPETIDRGLFLAASSGQLETVRFFVEELEADVNARYGRISGRPYQEKEPKQGADPPDISTPLSSAVNGLHTEVVQYLAGKGSRWEGIMNSADSMLHWVAGQDEPKLLELMIAEDFDVNAASDHGVTPLMRAVWSGPAENVRLLLDAGADISATNEQRGTLSEWASERGNREIQRLVEEAMAGAEKEKDR